MPRPRKSRERDVERLLREMLELRGYLVIKTDAGAINRHLGDAEKRRGDIPPGFPDLVALHPKGPPLFFEVKRDGGKLTPTQERYIAYLRERGFTVLVVYGEDGVMEALGQLK